MAKIQQRFFLLVGLVLYLFDLGSDIYVAVKYWKNDETWWFRLTIGFICVPSIIVNFTAIFQYMDIWTCIAAVLQLSVVGRYFEAVCSSEPNTYSLAKLRYLETMIESAPQWCLQVYIMLRQWSFPSYTVVSSVFSMLSLAWSIMTLEIEKTKKHYCCFGFFFFSWQLCVLVSRLSAIVLFAYVFQNYVFIPLAAHYVVLVLSIFLIEIRAEGGAGKSLWLSAFAAFPSLFHSANTVLPVKRAQLEMKVGYVLLILASIIMVTLSLVMPNVPHMDVIQPIAIASVAGALPLSLCCCCCVVMGNDDDNDDDNGDDNGDDDIHDNISPQINMMQMNPYVISEPQLYYDLRIN